MDSKFPVIEKTELKGLGVTEIKISQQLKKFTGLHTYIYGIVLSTDSSYQTCLIMVSLILGFKWKYIAAFTSWFDSPLCKLTISTFTYLHPKMPTNQRGATTLPVFPSSTSAGCIANSLNKHTLKCSLVDLSASTTKMDLAYVSFPYPGGDRGKVTCTMLT